MSAASRRNEHQQAYLRQATLLRKNLMEWDGTIRSPQGANWPSMLGRLNAAMVSSVLDAMDGVGSCLMIISVPSFLLTFVLRLTTHYSATKPHTRNLRQNQSSTLDRCIEPVLEHFVYVPKKCTANPQDIPFFLSTRLTTDAQKQKADTASGADKDGTKKDEDDGEATATDIAMGDANIEDPVKALKEFENVAAELAADYESKMLRF